MEELLVTIAKGLVEDKDAVSVTADAPDEEGMVVYHLDRNTRLNSSHL